MAIVSCLTCRSMNTFLIIYLGILLFEAILSTILKYAWQAETKWDEPFYNQKTDQERNSSKVTTLLYLENKNQVTCISITSYYSVMFMRSAHTDIRPSGTLTVHISHYEICSFCAFAFWRFFSDTCVSFHFTDSEIYFWFPGFSGVIQLHYPHFAVRDRWAAEVSGVIFHRLGLGSLPRRERPESSSKHIGPQRGARPGVCEAVRVINRPKWNFILMSVA